MGVKHRLSNAAATHRFLFVSMARAKGHSRQWARYQHRQHAKRGFRADWRLREAFNDATVHLKRLIANEQKA
jgi:hypothetical protein